MNYTNTDINNFYYLLESNVITYENAVKWAFSQYKDVGTEQWIKSISLAHDISEIIDILKTNHKINNQLSIAVQVGKQANDFFNKKITIDETLHNILYMVLIDNNDFEEKDNLYAAEDYLESHDNGQEQALTLCEKILKTYSDKYINTCVKFSA